MDNVLRQIELEKQITSLAVQRFQNEFEKLKQKNSVADTKTGSVIVSNIMGSYIEAIKQYLDNYSHGMAVRCTIAATTIQKLGAEVTGYIAAKIILNCTGSRVQQVYSAIGSALEDEYKMQSFRKENSKYYESIQNDLNSRGAKAQRKRYISQYMFNKRLSFHTNKWSHTERIQTGMILTQIFMDVTGLITYRDFYDGAKKKKCIKYIKATDSLISLIDNLNHKLEVLEPFFLPMLCPPKPWTGIFEGGYISPYIKANKVIKSNSKSYLKKLKHYSNKRVFDALNAIQNTAWQINSEVLNVIKLLWDEGKAVAGLPSRDDIPMPAYPFPNKDKSTILNEGEKVIISKWKRDTYEAHKTNIAQRSNRITTSQILRIADKFKDEQAIWFPYQMDFRGRMYPIPALLQPQGSDLAKGLLRFSRGKPLTNETAIKWWKIHGANMYGYDKASYEDRVKWIDENQAQILQYGINSLTVTSWMKADKPFQFLAWCKEYADWFYNPRTFETHIPIQLDGTCNGLQHYSALLRDEVAGAAVNLVNTPIPSDIYGIVAEKLTEKLKSLKNEKKLADCWLNIGINRKLTKRPVMVLPYGGTQLSCRQYIQAYLEENYSKEFLWKHFELGNNPNDCIFKACSWLSHYLWESIREVLKSAIIGMDYLKAIARLHLKYEKSIEWFTPLGLLIHQAYPKASPKQITTELYGKCLSVRCYGSEDEVNKQRQINGICPNFIHSMDASCLMLWLLKCKEAGMDSFMSVHDCYGVLAPDTEKSAQLLREAFVEIYQRPLLDDFTADLTDELPNDVELPERPKMGNLEIEEVLKSDYFFN